MRKSRLHTAWAGVGLTIAFLAGAPAWAEDVELLLSVPGASVAAKPNVLFILDSSGSMTSVEVSQEPFDKNKTYSGACDNGYYYWSKNSNLPSCTGSKLRRFEKSYFVCDQGVTQISDAGSYTDTMAQYRKRRGKWKWQTISRSKTQSYVECAADSGVHGDGTAGQVYAKIGSNTGSLFTSVSSAEVDWGSSPTHQIVTVYDSNYLNWFYNPPGSSMRRTDIVKAVTKNVLGGINNVNIGFMRFHNNEGGPVMMALKDLDTNRSEANSVVDSLPASGWTPLSETMYEAARYWNGVSRQYGALSSTDPDALVVGNNGMYKQPAEYACAKNFTVLLTDGQPTQDTGAYGRVSSLPNFTATMGRSSCTGGNVNGACLDDISEYLSKTDINANVPGNQNVTTYTIGFTVDLPLLKATAENSGGKYYLAEDVTSLTKALTDIVTNIFDRDISFTAPSIAVNAFNRTQHLNDLYVSVFRATSKQHWPGNIKKYTIVNAEIVDQYSNPAVDPNTGFFADSASNFWNVAGDMDGPDVNVGGAANLLPSADSRKLYTNNGATSLTDSSNSVSAANIAAFTPADLGLSGAPGEPDLPTLIEWARGADVKDEDNDPLTTTRQIMGDTLHSQPASIVYGTDANGDPDIVVFTATNDGYLHAIDAKSGLELWSFIPRELLPDLADLYFNENINFKHYGIDGDIVPVVADRNNNGVIDVGTDFVYLFFGMRRGGNNYYALDVTDKNAPKFKWLQSYPEFGQTWSSPVAARVKVNSPYQTSVDNAVLILGAGYDTVHDQAAHPQTADAEGTGIVMLDIETGAKVWSAGPDNGANLTLSSMTRSIPARVRVLDLSGDGFADRMYAADLGGQVWRFDILSGNSPNTLVRGGVIAQFGAEGQSSPTPAQTRRFYTTPDVSLVRDRNRQSRYLAISIGSGYRAHPLDKSAGDRFYSLRDTDVFHSLTQVQYDSYPIAGNNDMVEVSGVLNSVVGINDRGWRLTLPPGEKILSDSTTFNDSIFFVSFEPMIASTDPCQAGLSLNRLYRVDAATGDPFNPSETIDPDNPVQVNEERVTELAQGGIAPRPSFLFPSPTDPNCQGEECAPPPIGCVGVECFNPGYANNPVRTLWTQDGTN